MSDVPPTDPPQPGWVQASDGNWYPPEAFQTAATEPPPVASPPNSAPPSPTAPKWPYVVIALLSVALLGTVIALVAEDSDDGQAVEVTRSDDDSAVNDDDRTDDDDRAADESPTPQAGELGGSTDRDDPTPLGTPVRFEVDTWGDADKSVWELSTSEPGADLTDSIMAANTYNDPPESGSVFYGIDVELTLVSANKEPLSSAGNIQIELFGPDSKSVYGGTFDYGCGSVDNELDEYKEVFAGGSVSGTVCFEITAADAEAEPLLTLDEITGDRIFIATTG